MISKIWSAPWRNVPLSVRAVGIVAQSPKRPRGFSSTRYGSLPLSTVVSRRWTSLLVRLRIVFAVRLLLLVSSVAIFLTSLRGPTGRRCRAVLLYLLFGRGRVLCYPECVRPRRGTDEGDPCGLARRSEEHTSELQS